MIDLWEGAVIFAPKMLGFSFPVAALSIRLSAMCRNPANPTPIQNTAPIKDGGPGGTVQMSSVIYSHPKRCRCRQMIQCGV